MKKSASCLLWIITTVFIALQAAPAQSCRKHGLRPVTPEEMERAKSLQVEARLNKIILPSVDFEEITVGEAIDFVRLKTKELDTSQPDPAKKGFNFIIIDPKDANATNIPSQRAFPELRLKSVPAHAVLRYICDLTGLRYKIEPHAIVIR